MSTRPTLKPNIVIPSPAASPANTGSMAASITSAPTLLDKMTGFSYELSWTGTSPVGTASVQCSNSYALNSDGTVANAGVWTTMTFSYNGSNVTSVPISGNSGNGVFDIEQTRVNAVRLVYTRTSGTGTLLATIHAGVS